MSLTPNERTEARMKSYKSQVNADEARRRREDSLVDTRKNQREDNLLKKRLQPQLQSSLPTDAAQMSESIPAMVQGLESADPAAQLHAATQFKALLSTIGFPPPTDAIISAGVIPRLVEFLDRHDVPQLQFEAAWALSNVASGTSEHTQVVINHGAIPKFVQLLASATASDNVREQVVWALGNIAGESPSCRDLVLRHGALETLLAQLNENSNSRILRIAAWTLCNFFRAKPLEAPLEQLKLAFPVLECLIDSDDQEVVSNGCWALFYLSDVPELNIKADTEARIYSRLNELLHHPLPTVTIPVLKTVLWNIVPGDDTEIQFELDNNVLLSAHRLLTQSTANIVLMEACWVISRITGGTTTQIQHVIELGLVPHVMRLLENAEFEIKQEAAWAIVNAINRGTREQVRYMVNQGCIKPLCDLLPCPDTLTVTLCLHGLYNILKVGEADKNAGMTNGINIYAQLIAECGGVNQIASLQHHDDLDIFAKSLEMMMAYWPEGSDEVIPPDGDMNPQGSDAGESQSSNNPDEGL